MTSEREQLLGLKLASLTGKVRSKIEFPVMTCLQDALDALVTGHYDVVQQRIEMVQRELANLMSNLER